MPSLRRLPARDPTHYRIIDYDGIFVGDKDYCELGTSEGWLILDSIRGDTNYYRIVQKE